MPVSAVSLLSAILPQNVPQPWGWRMSMSRYVLIWLAAILVPVSVTSAQLEETKIGFASNADGDWDIYVVEYAGGGITNLTDDSPSIDWRLDWSPDGSQIAFTSDRDGDFDIYTMDADGRNVFNVTQATDPTGADDRSPSWSPDGTEIAFASDRYAGASFEICRIDPAGASAPVRLTREAVIYTADAEWSPDGSAIAFRRGNPTAIWRMDRNGGNQVQLSLFATIGDEEPAWSPDGLSIVFGRKPTQGAKHLYVMDAMLGESVGPAAQYTFGGYNEYPTWSPDGAEIAHSHDGGVYTMSAMPGAAREVLVSAGTMPEWSPPVSDSGTSVTVDIMPGSETNPVVQSRKGVVPVAVLTTDRFDATEIDDASVRLGPAEASIAHERAHHTDVDGDDRLDWVGHFRTRELGLSRGIDQLVLVGATTDARDIIPVSDEPDGMT
jgi:dipeptidyl aminopeptidase/acylaminoacyl peptidase